MAESIPIYAGGQGGGAAALANVEVRSGKASLLPTLNVSRPQSAVESVPFKVIDVGGFA